MLAELQQDSRTALIAADCRRGNHPVWGGPGWKVFQHTQEDMRRIVRYIEDNPANLRLVERIVSYRPGLTLLSAVQGRHGLELARDHQPRAIVLDLHLPDLDGTEVLARLRGDPSTRDIPVVIVSADATPGQVTRLLAQGADAYLTKPLDVSEFLALLDRLFNRTATPCATTT